MDRNFLSRAASLRMSNDITSLQAAREGGGARGGESRGGEGGGGRGGGINGNSSLSAAAMAVASANMRHGSFGSGELHEISQTSSS